MLTTGDNPLYEVSESPKFRLFYTSCMTIVGKSRVDKKDKKICAD